MPDRPEVICHMLTGLDARVEVGRWCPTKGAKRDDQIALYFRLQEEFGARGYIVGRVTMVPYATGKPCDPGGPAPDRTRFVAPQADLPLAIVLNPAGRLHWESATLDGDHLVMVVAPDVADSHLRELAERGISYLVSPSERIDPAWLLAQLQQYFAAERIMVEGGGLANGLFIEAGLVDKISLVMIPALDGSRDARNIIDTGEIGLADRLALSLEAIAPLDHQAVHLQYAVTYNR